MAKGQMKSNKEAKKPKAEKPKGGGFGLQAVARQGRPGPPIRFPARNSYAVNGLRAVRLPGDVAFAITRLAGAANIGPCRIDRAARRGSDLAGECGASIADAMHSGVVRPDVRRGNCRDVALAVGGEHRPAVRERTTRAACTARIGRVVGHPRRLKDGPLAVTRRVAFLADSWFLPRNSASVVIAGL